MTNKERIMNSIKGLPVDRPAVNFYEIGGFHINPNDPDEYNVYNSPDWKPLIELCETKTDIMRFGSAAQTPVDLDLYNSIFTVNTFEKDGSRYTKTVYKTDLKDLTSLTRRDPATDTVWTIEHLLKDGEDLKAYMTIPDEFFAMKYDTSVMDSLEIELGDRGVIMFDGHDPLCNAAGLFSMEDFTVLALTEEDMFRALLDKCAINVYDRYKQMTAQKKGYIWRLVGPEYAAPPYLPPRLFNEYVCKYDQAIIDMIHGSEGYVRLHCHGKIRNVLDMIVGMGVDGLDPIEPPDQGDVELSYVREKYGKLLTLFGNIEACDIENMQNDKFCQVVSKSIADGTKGCGRGFVLQPSSSPYGRNIPDFVIRNYEIMVESVLSC